MKSLLLTVLALTFTLAAQAEQKNITCIDKNENAKYPLVVRFSISDASEVSALKIGNQSTDNAFIGGVQEEGMKVVYISQIKFVETRASNLLVNADSFEPISLSFHMKTGKGTYNGPAYGTDGTGLRTLFDYDVNCFGEVIK